MRSQQEIDNKIEKLLKEKETADAGWSELIDAKISILKGEKKASDFYNPNRPSPESEYIDDELEGIEFWIHHYTDEDED